MEVYTCVCISMCTDTYIYTHTYISSLHMGLCVYIHIYAHTYIASLHMVCVYTCVHTYIHIHICVYVYWVIRKTIILIDYFHEKELK